MEDSKTLSAVETLKSLRMINEIEISFSSIIISLVLTLICTYLIKIFYVKYGRSLNNRKHFSNVFILLGIITAMVITVVKFSFALSLGLVGALSIVRFRAAIRDPEELVYLFLIIAIGIASGANQYNVSIFLTIASIIVIYVQNNFIQNDKGETLNINLIQVNCPKSRYDKTLKELMNLFNKYSDFVKLKSMSSEQNYVNLTFEISFKHKNNLKQITTHINKISNKNISINLISNVLVPE